MTTNNDTPQMFGEDARHDGVCDGEWRDGAGGQAWAGAEFESGPDALDPTAETGEARGPDEADPYVPWADWDEPAEMEAGGAAYPQPSFYPHESGYRAKPEHPLAPGYPEGFGYPRVTEYPRGPGYAPIPGDHPGSGEPGYPAGPGYVPDSGYRQYLGFPQDTWNEHGSGAAAGPGLDPGYPRAAGAVPAMEPLSGWTMPPRTMPPPPAGPVPPQRPAAAPMPPSADPDYEREAFDSLATESLLRGKRPGFGSGWRRGVARATGGLLRLGESSAEMRRRDLINRVRTPVAAGHHRVAVMSLKGGVGKTTTAVGLGATLATLRGDRVIAVDANPDRGTLSDKVRLETAATIRDLLNERDQVRRYADIRAFTSQAPSRLEVLASDRDPAVSVAFGADDYCDVARVLEHFYSICLTDCGTGLLHSAMSGVLRLADQIVVVSSPSVDGARSASATLDWLEAHHCGDLVRNGVVMLSTIRPKSKSTVDLDRLERHFAARCRAVVRIPYDAHLEEGAEVELELLGAETADAYLTLAAIVGDGLAWPRRMTSLLGLSNPGFGAATLRPGIGRRAVSVLMFDFYAKSWYDLDMKIGFRCRAYPDDAQQAVLKRTFGCVRLVWNLTLAARCASWQAYQKDMTYAESDRALTAMKRDPDMKFLTQVSAVPLQQALRHQQRAFSAFFAKRARFPRYKSRTGRQSATYTRAAFRMSDGELWLAKTDAPLRYVWTWPDIDPATLHPTSVTVAMDPAGRWFVTFQVDRPDPAPLPATGEAAGLDVGLASFGVLSTGEKVPHPRHWERHQRRLKRYQRRLARCQRGSANRAKARVRVARVHAKIADARRDFLHQTSTALIHRFDLIAIEDLNVAGMVLNRRLARAICCTGWGEHRRMLEYKAQRYKRKIVVVDRWYPSSKTCSACGHLLACLDLGTRYWTCPACGARHDRDVNAAKNILAAGLAVAACRGTVTRPGAPLGAGPGETGNQRARAPGIPALMF